MRALWLCGALLLVSLGACVLAAIRREQPRSHMAKALEKEPAQQGDEPDLVRRVEIPIRAPQAGAKRRQEEPLVKAAPAATADAELTPEQEQAIVHANVTSMDAFFDVRGRTGGDYDSARLLDSVFRTNPSMRSVRVENLECRSGACRFEVPEITPANYAPLANELPKAIGSAMPTMRILVQEDPRGRPRAKVYLGRSDIRFPPLK